MTETNQASLAVSVTVPTVGQKRLVIVGASGMVGGYALRFALENPAVGSVMSIGRRKLDISHPKLKQVLHLPVSTPQSTTWVAGSDIQTCRVPTEPPGICSDFREGIG